MRVVSICPSNTEIVDYLGKTEDLVAVDDFSDWPPEIHHLPKVGPDLSINIDQVEAMKPDLVLASLSVPGMEKNIEGLEKRKIPFITLNPNSLQEIANDIRIIGEALGYKKVGIEKAEQFEAEVRRFKAYSDQIKNRPSLYWEWWPKPVFTPGGLNWLSEISRLAGAYNIFETKHEASVQTDWDEVKRKNPDHICMVWVGVKESKMNPELIKKRPGWSELAAVKNKRIHILEESLYCRPSPRLLEGLEKLLNIIHS
ncbi:iron complex transport system substrate-binding protein [Bacillus oleivorans]|uniref:Iron complex transport system substrate-binding protein n=1 Tax=Bacillus oleivorans TaxID=1448271 RepID=A0A285CSP9_9BACI|nr:cobalamin-binding protein [Bacillus oleivorans]SNX70587.1 iron complex transport system substrate-binding protein [Bacillus oleivorans]